MYEYTDTFWGIMFFFFISVHNINIIFIRQRIMKRICRPTIIWDGARKMDNLFWVHNFCAKLNLLFVVLVTKKNRRSLRWRRKRKIYTYRFHWITLVALLGLVIVLFPSDPPLNATTSWRFNKVNPREVSVSNNVLLHYSLHFSYLFYIYHESLKRTLNVRRK